MEIIIITSTIGLSAVISLDENRGFINETVMRHTSFFILILTIYVGIQNKP
jgi:hypothetical protein